MKKEIQQKDELIKDLQKKVKYLEGLKIEITQK